MKRLAMIACVLSISMVCLAGCGCSDKEKDQAMSKWEAFKKGEMDKIEATYANEEMKPHDFKAKVVEEKGSLYSFKGFLSFKRGNTYQEKFFAYMDGAWKPVDYRKLKDKKAMKKEKEEIGKIKDQIEELKEEIEDEQEKLEKHEDIFIKIETQKEKLTELEKKMDALTTRK